MFNIVLYALPVQASLIPYFAIGSRPNIVANPPARTTSPVYTPTAVSPAGTTSAIASPTVVMNSQNGVDVVILPDGVKEVSIPPISDFCKQFVGKNGIKEADGTQLKNGGQSCSSTPIGLLPNVDRMMSTIISQPNDGATLDSQVNITVAVRTNNLETGFFSDPNKFYYLIPSALSKTQGIVFGHQHIVVQALGDGTQPLDPRKFAFFKGVNEQVPGGEANELKATIPAGTLTENGIYRICSITGSFGHQSAVSPVQRRGPQDDCIQIRVNNAPQKKQDAVADDVSESTKVTVNGKDTNVDVRMENGGKDGSGRDMYGAIKAKNQEKAQKSITRGQIVSSTPVPAQTNVPTQAGAVKISAQTTATPVTTIPPVLPPTQAAGRIISSISTVSSTQTAATASSIPRASSSIESSLSSQALTTTIVSQNKATQAISASSGKQTTTPGPQITPISVVSILSKTSATLAPTVSARSSQSTLVGIASRTAAKLVTTSAQNSPAASTDVPSQPRSTPLLTTTIPAVEVSKQPVTTTTPRPAQPASVIQATVSPLTSIPSNPGTSIQHAVTKSAQAVSPLQTLQAATLDGKALTTSITKTQGVVISTSLNAKETSSTLPLTASTETVSMPAGTVSSKPYATSRVTTTATQRPGTIALIPTPTKTVNSSTTQSQAASMATQTDYVKFSGNYVNSQSLNQNYSLEDKLRALLNGLEALLG
jgi:hypothetical protein